MLVLKVKKRDITGGEKLDLLRKQGFIPAVLYGPKIKPLKIVVNGKEFSKVFGKSGEASMVNLKIEGDEQGHSVFIKDLQIHPLTDEFIHIDFYQPILTEKTEANVPLVFEGEAPVVKEKNAILIKDIDELAVSALPMKIPSEIKVDVSKLKDVSDIICVKDLSVPAGVEILRGADEVIASVSQAKSADEVAEEMKLTEEEELFVGEETPLEKESGEKDEATEEQKEIEV